MKTSKILTLLSMFMVMLFISACVNDDDFATPNITVQDPNISTEDITTFKSVVDRYNQALADGEQIATYDIEDAPIYLEGYVISSDQAGNFFEEIIIQNKVDGSSSMEDPRLGFRVDINTNSLYNTYEFGRKVYIKLNGLAVGEDNGVLAIGKANGNSIEQIQAYEYANFIIRGVEVADITPKLTTIDELEPQDINTLLQFDNVQFNRNLIGETYAGATADEFDGFRTIESCDSNASISLQTSTFADFKSFPLETGRGSITAIYSRDFGDDFDVLIINSRADVDFVNTDRCDPDVLECTGASGGGSTIYLENFEGFGTYASEGWTNLNVSGTDTDWFISSFSGNNYSRISAFSSGNAEATVWLVTPSIDLSATTGEELSFDIEAAYDTGTILTLLIADDFTGDVDTASWQILDATVPVGPANSFGGLQPIGPINISCLDGTVNVAFLYEGSDPSATTRYHVDNIKVTGNN